MLFFEDGNALFTISLMLMLMLAALEIISTLVGFGLSSMLDSVMPDFDFDVEAPEFNHSWSGAAFLGWLKFGELPMLIILIVFLTSFGITGLIIQQLAFNLFGTLLPTWLALVPVLLLSIPQMRVINGTLSKYLFKDETESISRDSFIGQTARITIGTAAQGQPAEAKFTDQFGTTHYLMVEPDNDDTFSQGEEVLLVREAGATFKVIKPEDLYKRPNT